MLNYTLRRLLMAIPTLIFISLVIFLLLELAPGDPLADMPLTIPPEVREKIRRCFGPLPEKTPLNPRITGTLDRDAYTIEKVIFESRPHVTADAGALCLKSGNAALLRAGSDSLRTSLALAGAVRSGIAKAGLPADAIQLVPVRDRDAVGHILAGLGGTVDVVVPRGGRSLVERVQADARVPVFAHLDGNCHVYVHAGADLAMAKAVVLNAKLRRTGVCGSAETLLVDRQIAASHLKPLIGMLLDAGCAVRGDEAVLAADARVTPATEADWATEYLDAIIAVRVVDGPDEAIAHVERYGSHHTDAIITHDEAVAARFLAEVDSAIVIHNASTQFADGGEFGFGAEIGIATGRMHARGPVGVEQLCSFKYRVLGSGQIRP